MIRRYDETNFITGMRAVAALAVVMIHCGGAGLRDWGEFGNELADLGATGVYVFFTISGFSIAASYSSSTSAGSFLVRRFFRLAPVYYAFLGIALALLWLGLNEPNCWAELFEVPIDSYNLLLHGLFLGFLDHRVNNSLIGVEWSLNVEMFWYLLAPALLAAASRYRKSLWIALAAVLAVFFLQKVALRALLPAADAGYVIQWSPLTYGFAFVLGVIAWDVRNRGWKASIKTSDFCALGVGCVLLLQCLVSLMEIHLLIPLLTFVLLLTGRDVSLVGSRVFGNPVALLLGTISYSIYLWHFLLYDLLVFGGWQPYLGDGLLMFGTVLALTVPLSLVTYYGIERPFNLYGRMLEQRLQKPAVIPTSEKMHIA